MFVNNLRVMDVGDVGDEIAGSGRARELRLNRIMVNIKQVRGTLTNVKGVIKRYVTIGEACNPRQIL